MTISWTEPGDELDLLDLVEELVRAQGWPCERDGEEQLIADVPGQWTTYRVLFDCYRDLALFSIVGFLGLTVPDARLPALVELLHRANPKVAVGHFEMWPNSRIPVFRLGMPLQEGGSVPAETVADLLDIVVSECDRFLPAFRAVVEQDCDPEAALAAAVLETEGEA